MKLSHRKKAAPRFEAMKVVGCVTVGGLMLVGVSTAAAQVAEVIKRYWVDQSAGVSVAFPTGDPLRTFSPSIRQPEGDQVLIMQRPLLMSERAVDPILAGVTVCTMRKRYVDQGAMLQRLLQESLAAGDGGKAYGQRRCETAIYGQGATEKVFYGTAIEQRPDGLRETCTAAYTLPAGGDFPRLVSQSTIFTAGGHGYELQCTMSVKSESASTLYWAKQARDIKAIADSIARLPATP